MANGTATVDYNALAKQAGAVSSLPPGGKVDYAALAKQTGATSSTPAPARAPTYDPLAGASQATSMSADNRPWYQKLEDFANHFVEEHRPGTDIAGLTDPRVQAGQTAAGNMMSGAVAGIPRLIAGGARMVTGKPENPNTQYPRIAAANEAVGGAVQSLMPFGLVKSSAAIPAVMGFSAGQKALGAAGNALRVPPEVSEFLGNVLTGVAVARKIYRSPQDDFGTNYKGASRLLQTKDAIDKGIVQVVNDHVRGTAALLDNSVDQEVGRHVQAAIAADKMDLAKVGSKTGTVTGTQAANDMLNFADQRKIELPKQANDLIDTVMQPMDLETAKVRTTAIGKAMAAASRQNNPQLAEAYGKLYEGMHDATQARADNLGMGKSWKQYIDLTRTYKNLQSGLLGELVDEPNHAKVMDKLIDPTRATEWNELRDEIQKRGIDPSKFEQARDDAQSLSRLVSTNSNLFMGKLRAMINHPFTAGPTAIAASEVGH